MEKTRQDLVEYLRADGIGTGEVLAAMARVPRHLFVPWRQREWAYEDRPLPIAADQSISQPRIVAQMTAAAQIEQGARVLEVGTGSGYQAAVLRAVGAEVFSIELEPRLATAAGEALATAGVANGVTLRQGDGAQGWPEHAPFAAIVVTAAVDEVPQALVEQMEMGGRLVLPLGPRSGVQRLKVLRRHPDGLRLESEMPVRFVPLRTPRPADSSS